MKNSPQSAVSAKTRPLPIVPGNTYAEYLHARVTSGEITRSQWWQAHQDSTETLYNRIFHGFPVVRRPR